MELELKLEWEWSSSVMNRVVLAIFALIAGVVVAPAQTFPSRPVTIIVPFPAGGPTDTLARIFAEYAKGPLGQPVIVENVAGAGASIGIGRAVAAAPDGYTLSLGNWTSHVGAGAIYPVTWHILNDLAPVAKFPVSTLMIVGRTNLPASNIKELIAWMKANPGKASIANIGSGSGAHICSVYFNDKVGVSGTFVPYKGGAPVMQDLVGNQIDMFCAEASQTLAHVRAGKMKAFVTLSEKRWTPLPDVPTMAETVSSDIVLPFWHGLWAPKNTPKDVIAKLNATVTKVFADPAVQKRISDLGMIIPTAAEATPEALGAYHKTEVEKWWPIIKAAVKQN
jgi:tripartite-type tricarboxylate transporter receptor subunit TctC